ncbi:non-oxidative hydroxyarylic acid decarboxylases subunit D [Pseudonocardia sp. HH130629-09]|uniref:non-oxidative hydroxyarylic acid decarboxylases subunit D n=1 Tax=Pseudonocardia sp. HH130629-09 TaxID=1641402 RepID=UPI0006CB27F7|nr:non-oxidative hydroxyarylic acid decarboxylases subunit D [Pseudonocardia sp. HH130629-09]ALE85566.1 hypothetical protein XF36_22440 [Pseudonocardia sp. HH130629-09]
MTCPRCSTDGAAVLATSPVPGVWTVHRRGLCGFVRRDTEPPAVRAAAHYPDRFRVTADDVAVAVDVPTVPARRT